MELSKEEVELLVRALGQAIDLHFIGFGERTLSREEHEEIENYEKLRKKIQAKLEEFAGESK